LPQPYNKSALFRDPLGSSGGVAPAKGAACNDMTEEWKPVLSHPELYEVSNFGRVRSKSRIVNNWRASWIRSERMLKLIRTKIGYPVVFICSNGSCKRYYVHTLVLEAFVGPRPKGSQGCHGDGNPHNNMLANLRWDTPAGNAGDAIRHGRSTRGERSHACVISQSEALEIKTSTERTSVLAKMYGISPASICDIRKGRTWKWLHPK